MTASQQASAPPQREANNSRDTRTPFSLPASHIHVICLTGNRGDFEIEIEVPKALKSRVRKKAQERSLSAPAYLKRLTKDWIEDGQIFVDRQSLRKLLSQQDAP